MLGLLNYNNTILSECEKRIFNPNIKVKSIFHPPATLETLVEILSALVALVGKEVIDSIS